MSFQNKNIKVIKEALKQYHENPSSHSFTEKQVEELLKIKNEVNILNEQTENNFEQIKLLIENGLKKFKQNLDAVLKISLNDLKYIVNYGWYISYKAFEDISVEKLIYLNKKENVLEFENYIVSSFDKRVKKIIEDLNTSFPERTHLFTEIKQLYKKEYYHSLITLCYSQVDGISNNVFGIGFFDTENKDKQFSLKLPSNLKFDDDSLIAIISKQLNLPKNEITKYTKDDCFTKDNKLSSFNRHFIMHGHSYNYGNKKNAIRAILLLEFVGWIVKESKINTI